MKLSPKFKDTICTWDVVQVGFGDKNGDFNFNTFLLNTDSDVLDIVCKVQFCLSSENCFKNLDAECGDMYTKN